MVVSSTWPSVPAIAERSPAMDLVAGRRQRAGGQGLVEYGLILVLIAVVTAIALVFFGDALAAALTFIGQTIDSAH